MPPGAVKVKSNQFVFILFIMLKRIVFFVLITILIGLPVYLGIMFYFLDGVYFFCPIHFNGDMVIRCDSRGDGNFAARRNGRRVHNGIDLLSEIGTQVFACRSGRVRVAEQKDGMGKYIILYHQGNINTTYGHLSTVEVRNGDFVRQGELIGRVGKTGNANHPDMQPHLHFEVRKDGTPQDPMEYLE